MVAIIDYGMGNLYSAQKACEFSGHSVSLVQTPEEVLSAEKLILPGVGAFQQAMEQLHNRRLDEAIRTAVQKQGTPLLGICLGMQLLFEESEEAPGRAGLSLLRGKITLFSSFPSLPGIRWKVPHMGWNRLHPKEGSRLMQGVQEGEQVYFVHSYRAADVTSPAVAAVTPYGHDFASAFEQGNVFATQFHPEKSGNTGMKILKNFLELSSTAHTEGV